MVAVSSFWAAVTTHADKRYIFEERERELFLGARRIYTKTLNHSNSYPISILSAFYIDILFHMSPYTNLLNSKMSTF